MKNAHLISIIPVLLLAVTGLDEAEAGAVVSVTSPGLEEASAYLQEPRKIEGDYRVSGDDVIREDLVVVGGTLTVDGEIHGNVVVSYGDAVIRGAVEGLVVAVYGDVMVIGEGLIQGDAVSVGGDVVVRDSGVVTGSKVTTTLEGLRSQSREKAWVRAIRAAGVIDKGEMSRYERERAERDWESESREGLRRRRWPLYQFLNTGSFPLGGVVYNRVDGLTIQGRIFSSNRNWGGAATGFYASAGYGFASKHFYYRLGLNRYWLPTNPIEIGASIYKQLESEDTWYMKPNENDLYAFLARYDWFDYYMLEGFQGHIRFTPQPWVQVGVRYAQESENSVERNTNWAIFGRNHDFRENEWMMTYDADPLLRVTSPADEGELHRWIYFMRVDVASWGRVRPRRGFVLDVSMEEVEHQGIGAGSAFDYKRLQAQFLGYMSISRIDHLALRVRFGSSRADPGYSIPVQHRYYLGGVGSLRGYAFKQFNGDRLFLATLEYTLGGEGWSPFFDDWAVTAFFDYGHAWYTEPFTGLYTDLMPEDAKRGVGVAISPFGWDGFRIELARPLDAEDKEFVYYIRLKLDY